ncbi:hypothetical protein [Cupriavidus sp. UYPR2.512]|uniref:hypothetical protein n=1 Tax=Cupriavidus sp. UYPR2.512 TaxID=1080187 RepID=UPI001E57AAC2|nr:hypothetical protein [Cupriavidus sp. UYPR2.512]
MSFEFGKGKDGWVQALNVTIVGAPKSGTDTSLLPVLAGLVALRLIVGGAFAGYFPRQAGIVSFMVSVFTFFAYADDKRRASRNACVQPFEPLVSQKVLTLLLK